MPDSIISAPVTVPANFVGICTGDIVTATGVTYGLVRNWDYKGSNGFLKDSIMTFINPSAGVYDWSTFDQLFSNNTTKDVIFTLGNPPDYLVSRAAVGGAYRGTKGNMCPDDLTGWATAVQAVVSRAKNTFGRTGLKWELWNEMDQTACYGDTLSLLGPYTKATAQAIKAIDSTAVILGPSIAGASQTATAYSYITLSDGAGGTVQSWLDGLSLHYYNQTISLKSPYENPINYCNAFKTFQGAMVNRGCNLPIWMTESGVISADTSGGMAYQRRLLTWAALGAKCALLYQYDSASYPINIYAAQINDVAAKLMAGNVISRCELGVANMTITINGVSYTY